MNPIKVDLHSHTVFSDGVHTPTELVKMAHDKGLSILAITDHDSVNALNEATECGHKFGMEIIPGLELSTDVDDREVHILAYFIDTNNEELQKYLSFFRDERFHRARRMVQKLRNLDQKISIEDVMEKAKNSAVGRPHIAYTMVDLGIVKNYQEAFERFIGDRGPAFERKIHVSLQSALKLISDSGGLSFVAHPGYMKEELLKKIIDAGIDGIEVVHPSHNENQIQFYRGIVNQYCLLETGGSDFHGGKKMDSENLGKYYISGTQLDLMKNMILKNKS